MFDIKQVEAEARKEIADEAAKVAKGKIKASITKIAAAEQIVANLRQEHEVLLRTIGAAA